MKRVKIREVVEEGQANTNLNNSVLSTRTHSTSKDWTNMLALTLSPGVQTARLSFLRSTAPEFSHWHFSFTYSQGTTLIWHGAVGRKETKTRLVKPSRPTIWFD